MLGLCVKACCEDEEIRAFDFMGGDAAYKWMWAHEHRTLVRHEAQRRNVRTIAQGAWTAVGGRHRPSVPRDRAHACSAKRDAAGTSGAAFTRSRDHDGAGYGCDEVDRGFAFFAHWSAQLSISATVCSTDSRA